MALPVGSMRIYPPTLKTSPLPEQKTLHWLEINWNKGARLGKI